MKDRKTQCTVAHGVAKSRTRLSDFPFAFLDLSSNNLLEQEMLKILQARLQQYVNQKLPDVQAGFRKDIGTRGQIDNIRWIIEKAREFQKNLYFCFIDYTKVFVWITTNCGKF